MTRRGRGLVLALASASALVGDARAGDAPAAADAALARLRRDVEFLASPELGGRKDPADRAKAARWVEAGLKAAGLVPLPGRSSMLLPFPEKPDPQKPDAPRGENVAGWIPGAGPDHVIVSAHYDHLGRKRVEGRNDGEVHPGADDNASGVAALLECARVLGKAAKPRRSIVFVAFDLEEGEPGSTGPVGSTAWVESPPLPIERLSAFVTADMLGRSLGDAFPGTLFVMGSERATALEAVVRRLDVPEGHRLHRLGMDFNQLGWSDYLPFERARVPCLFFTSGACLDYHRPGDVAEKIDWPRLAVNTRLLTQAVHALAELPPRPVWYLPGPPRWIESPEPSMDEVRSVLEVVARADDLAGEWGVPEGQRQMLRLFRGMIQATVERGTLTSAQRMVIRMGALRLFAAAQAIRPR